MVIKVMLSQLKRIIQVRLPVWRNLTVTSHEQQDDIVILTIRKLGLFREYVGRASICEINIPTTNNALQNQLEEEVKTNVLRKFVSKLNDYRKGKYMVMWWREKSTLHIKVQRTGICREYIGLPFVCDIEIDPNIVNPSCCNSALQED